MIRLRQCGKNSNGDESLDVGDFELLGVPSCPKAHPVNRLNRFVSRCDFLGPVFD
jgi:hypothetical protein